MSRCAPQRLLLGFNLFGSAMIFIGCLNYHRNMILSKLEPRLA